MVKQLTKQELNGYIGKTSETAKQMLEKEGWQVRVLDESTIGTMDFNINRITLETEEGIVISAVSDMVSVVQYWVDRKEVEPDAYMPDGVEERVATYRHLID